MIQITKPSDLIKTEPLINNLTDENMAEAIGIIQKALVKCSESLGINMSQGAIQTISEDLIEFYRHDSIEDIIYSLKQGRMGVYGFGHNSRSSLNMVLISEWMEKTLETKIDEREKEHKKMKGSDKDELPNIDYNEYKKRLNAEKEEIKEIDAKERAYREFKFKYQQQKAEENE